MGLRVPWDPEFDGMRVTYIPDGLRDASGRTELGPDGLSRVWTGEGGRSVRVEFVHGLRAKNLTTLCQVSWPAKDMALDLRPASVRGLPAYHPPGLAVRTAGLGHLCTRPWVILVMCWSWAMIPTSPGWWIR
ncbi:hypothetical protein ABH927_002271 [Planotetraspora sp. GP83]